MATRYPPRRAKAEAQAKLAEVRELENPRKRSAEEAEEQLPNPGRRRLQATPDSQHLGAAGAKKVLCDSNKRNNQHLAAAAAAPELPAVSPKGPRARTKATRVKPVVHEPPEPSKEFHETSDFPDPVPVKVVFNHLVT
jgi:hypothetical protein